MNLYNVLLPFVNCSAVALCFFLFHSVFGAAYHRPPISFLQTKSNQISFETSLSRDLAAELVEMRIENRSTRVKIVDSLAWDFERRRRTVDALQDGSPE